MTLDSLLIDVLACPEDKGSLLYFEAEDRLYNPRLDRSYEIREGIPVMLIDEATTVDDAEHARLMALAESGGAVDRRTDRVVTPPPAAGSPAVAPSPLGVDSLDMWGATVGLPEQVEAALAAAQGVAGLPSHRQVENVVVAGMGGSGIAGDVVLAAAAPFMPVPVTVVKGYELPDFVGANSLVFAMSFSGDTEETLEAVGQAYESGAAMVVVTSGGQLGRLAGEWHVPVIGVPADIPQPRAALGAMAIPPLVVLEEIGLFPGAVHWAKLAVRQLRRRRDQLVKPGNLAEEVARRIGRTIPLIHSSQALGAAAALRWKAQVNENAKAPAFFNVYPELCHNEIAGWGQNGDVTRQLITLVNLRHGAEHPQVARRFALVAEVLREVVADIIEVRAAGEGDLAQLFDLAIIGDFVSLHLAGHEGIDPGPIPVLTELKERLAES